MLCALQIASPLERIPIEWLDLSRDAHGRVLAIPLITKGGMLKGFPNHWYFVT